MIATLGLMEHPARILVVDDERTNRELLEVMLVAEGFDVVLADDGPRALAMVAEQRPDLILLDVMMPGMDGYEVAARIKRNSATSPIPIIMVTALDSRDARMLGLGAGAEDFLTKPVDRGEVCLRVKNLLRLKAHGDHYDRYSQVLEREVALRTADLMERTRTLELQASVLLEQAALLDLAKDAIVVRDMDSRIVSWSHGAEGMYGWSEAEALGRTIDELLSPELSEAGDAIEAALLASGQWEGEEIHHDRRGNRLNVASRLSLQRGADGAPHRILSINNDITDRKRAEAESHLLTERLSLATAVARVGVWEWDRVSDSLTWDATMLDIYRFPPELPIPYGRWSASICGEDLPQVEAERRRVIVEKGQGVTEFRIVLDDGSMRNIASVEKVILDEHEDVIRVIGVSMDITERRTSEKVLEISREKAMRFKDEFLSHVSHELRSPLTAIKQFTSILLRDLAGELNPEQRQYQEIVERNVQQLQGLIDDLLEVTRLETGKLTVELGRVLVPDVVRDAMHTLEISARTKGVALTCSLPDDLDAAHADPSRLLQVLIILLDNAVKFTPAGGSVEVRVGPLPRDPHFLRFEVSDTGCGVEPELAERLFERLYQAAEPARGSRKGLGLGLYICKQLVVRQGGEIRVDSHAGQGSTFSFTLPVLALETLLAPYLHAGHWPSDSAAVLTAHFHFRAEPLCGPPEGDWSQQARRFLQRCLMRPELDLLLAGGIADAKGLRLFVTVFADDPGTSVLVRWIHEQFEQCRPLNQIGLTLEVSHCMLPPFPRDATPDEETALASMAREIERIIESQPFTGAHR